MYSSAIVVDYGQQLRTRKAASKKLDVLPSAWSKTSIPNISAQKSLPFHEAKFVEGALTGEVEAILADLK